MNPIYSEELKQHLTSALAAFVRQTGISLKDLKSVCAEMDAMEADEHDFKWKQRGLLWCDGFWEGDNGYAVPLNEEEARQMFIDETGCSGNWRSEIDSDVEKARKRSVRAANQENKRRMMEKKGGQA